MRAKFGSRLILLALLGLVVQTNESRADFAQCTNPLAACTVTSSGCCKATFAPSGGNNPLIIAMDRCHQPIGTGALGPSGVGAPRAELSGTSIVRIGSNVLVSFSGGHGLADGQIVRVGGTSNSALHGTFAIKTGSSCTIGSGTGTCTGTEFQYATTGSGAIGPLASVKVLTYNPGNGWCGDAVGTATRIGGVATDEGMLRAYGLIYRLMQHGIPVYWLVNPTKTVLALDASQNAGSQTYLASDVDLWVLTSDLTDPPHSSQALTACTGTCTQPVHRLEAASLTAKTDSYQYKEFPVRGGAFLIASENRAEFNDFWKRTGVYSTLSATKYAWTTSGIDLYEIDASSKLVYQDYTSGDGVSTAPYMTVVGAPLAIKIDYEPPRIACLGCNSAVPQAWLASAGLEDPATAASCASGEFVPSDATYCLLQDFDVAQGTLVSGGFSWLWMFGYNDNSPCANSAEKAVFDKVRDFMTSVPAIRNAGHGVFLDDTIKVAEGCPGKQLMGNKQTTSDGVDIQSSGNAEPFILRHPNNLFTQIADLPPASASGTVKGWKYFRSSTPTMKYQTPFHVSTSSLRRLMTVDTTGTNNTLCIQHASTPECDAFTPTADTGDLHDLTAYVRLDDNLNNGLAYYLAGNQLNNNGNLSELRMLLNSLLALPDETFTTSPTETEVARSSPIIFENEDAEVHVYQGTYTHYNPVPSIPKATTASGLARFTFPYTLGHLRAIPIGSFGACSGIGCDTGNGSRTAINALTGAVFDAANGIPAVTAAGCANYFNGSCRTVFTTHETGRVPTHVKMTTGDVNSKPGTAVATLGETLASNLTTTEQQTLISRILAGRKDAFNNWVPKLGGVDRSTPAVIEPSPIAGSLGRPTMVYFGATDGMLHAVCASTGGGCDQVGRELWAYIPRTVLADLRQSTARVDGSPHVIDAFGDFDNNGTAAWHTILIFHTGTGRMTADNVVPAVYAIDVTTPNNPRVLWEYAVPDVGARGTYDMGVGLNLSAGTVTISSAKKTVAYMQTTNGGTGGAASVITAIDVETGAELWQFGDLYPTSGGNSGRNSAHEAAPSSGIPGGAVGLDTTGTGKITKVVYGTLYGDVFVRSADTGAPTNGSSSTAANPLLRISTDYKPIGVPPAIYQLGSTQYAVFATGGYADSQATLWRGENEATLPTQMVFAVSTGHTGGTITEADSTGLVPVKFDLGPGEGGFAQVTIIGGEIFATTDSTNVNLYDFGTSGAPTGKVYRYDFGAATPAQGATMVIASGAGSIFNHGTTLINASGKYGERLTGDAISTTGAAVDPMATTNKLKRALWLRTE
ncbi:MAG TPA: hypothetical protein VIV11_24695 [Kofleriaceae bacterium]